MKLLGTQNYKTVKGEKKGVITGILYLAPASISGWNVCPKASEGCKKACLYKAGRGGSILFNMQGLNPPRPAL